MIRTICSKSAGNRPSNEVTASLQSSSRRSMKLMSTTALSLMAASRIISKEITEQMTPSLPDAYYHFNGQSILTLETSPMSQDHQYNHGVDSSVQTPTPTNPKILYSMDPTGSASFNSSSPLSSFCS